MKVEIQWILLLSIQLLKTGFDSYIINYLLTNYERSSMFGSNTKQCLYDIDKTHIIIDI
jgi:hypothetical protein